MVKTYNRIVLNNNITTINSMKKEIDKKDKKNEKNEEKIDKKNEKEIEKKDEKKTDNRKMYMFKTIKNSYEEIDSRLLRLENQMNMLINENQTITDISKKNEHILIDHEKKLTGHTLNMETLQKRLNIKIRDTSDSIESYKKQTDQRIEKLVKLFLSLSK